MVTHHCHTSLSLTSQAPFTKSLWPKSPWSTVVWPLLLKVYESTLDPLWVCPVRKLPLLQDGILAKIADDLYCGGNTPQELFCNWKRVLQALHNCNLRLSAHKTIICPKTTSIFGCIFSAGSLCQSPPLKHPRHVPWAEHSGSDEILHWGIQSPVPCHPKVLQLPHSPGSRLRMPSAGPMI